MGEIVVNRRKRVVLAAMLPVTTPGSASEMYSDSACAPGDFEMMHERPALRKEVGAV
jgi:hypothetical protein